MSLPDLAALDAPADHRDRMKALVGLGRAAAAGDPDAAATLDALTAGGVWHRVLAAWAGYGHRDPRRLVPLCTDRSRTVRKAALKAAMRVLDDDTLGGLLPVVPTRKDRCALAVTLSAKRKNPAPVDRWLAGALKGSTSETQAVIDLLPFASRARVDAHAGTFAELSWAWSRLANHRPEVAVALIQRLAAGAERLGHRDLQFVHLVLPILADRAPDSVVPLVADLVRRGLDPQQVWGWTAALRTLARRRPAATFDALASVHAEGRTPPPGAFARVVFDRRTHTLGLDRIGWLMEHAWTALPDGRQGVAWWLALSAADRAAVVERWVTRGKGPWGAFLLRGVPPNDPRRDLAYRRWQAATRNAEGHVPVALLRFLPYDLRAREAKRHFDDPQLAASLPVRLPYASLLRFADAGATLAPFLGHPEGEVRAMALTAWIGTVRHDRGALGAALDAVAARRFEQDPVRLAMLTALDQLPTEAFAASALPALGAVLDHAWDAGDLSAMTASAAERLAFRGFCLDLGWGVTKIERALATRGTLHTRGAYGRLPRATRAALLPALERIAGGWLGREKWPALEWLCANVGRDLPQSPVLGGYLAQVAREVPFPGSARAALDLLAAWDPRAFGEVADALVASDPSAVVFPAVANHVSCRRQSLLDRVLVPRMTGKWATGRTGWVVHFSRGQPTWSAGQQDAWAKLADDALADPKIPVPDSVWLLVGLAALGYADPSRLLARLDDVRPPVREMAVRLAGRLDGDVAAGVLVRCLGDDRARFAIYALRQALAELSPDDALRTLLAAPRTRVTVAKEVVRLVGEIRTEPAYRALLALGAETLHRDVRIALLRGLWTHLERAETWPLFRRAATDPDWVVASRLASIGGAVPLSTKSDAEYCALLAGILKRPEIEVRQEILSAAQAAPLRDPDRALFRAIVARITAAPTSAERKLALKTAIDRARNSETATIASVLVRAAQAGESGFRVVAEALELLGWGGWLDVRVDGLRRELAAGIGADPQHAASVLRLYVGREEAELVVLLKRFAASGWLGYDAIEAAIGAVGRCLHPDAVETALRREKDPTLRRIGLAALLAAVVRDHGWTPDRLTTLATYRKDASPLVAGPARLVFPAPPLGAGSPPEGT